MAPDWDDLRVFLAVARAESLSRAGKALKKDAATVGRRVARLEAALGTPLFAKSPQGYALTDAGARLMTHAEAAEQALRAGAEELAGQAGQLSGQVRIGAPDGCANFVLPQVCAQISQAHPELDLQIVALPRVINLSKREADIAVAVSPPEAGRLTVQKITDYHLHLAASEDYLAGAGALNGLADLPAHPVVGYIPDMIFDKELDYLSETGAERVSLASNSVSVQLWLLKHGGGVGIAHDFAIPFAPGLRRVLTHELSLTRSFYLIRHAGDARVERLSRVAEELAQGIRAEVARLESMA